MKNKLSKRDKELYKEYLKHLKEEIKSKEQEIEILILEHIKIENDFKANKSFFDKLDIREGD